MLCDECRENEATYTVSVMMGEEMRIRHLCPACMTQMNRSLRGSDFRSILAGLLSAIGETRFETADSEDEESEEEERPTAPDIACPRCGTTLSTMTKQGRLGCPGCYEAFREQLQPMLMQIHGRVTHAGRAPLTTREAQQHRNRQEELTRRMLQAVAEEDFETAAQLRDRLKALAAGEEEDV